MNEIIVGVDQSGTAREAARQAAELASNCNRPLHIVMAISDASGKSVKAGGETWHEDAISVAEQAMLALAGELHASTKVTNSVVIASPAKALCEEASRLGASMIVVGNKRVQGASRVLGSVAADVLRHAPCNVLIVHTT